MTHTLNVEYRKVETLIPFARNPRTHSEAQIAKLAASIVEFGWTNPVLVDGSHGIIAGHGRLAAARKLGLTEVPVIELDHLTTAQKRAYVIADNRLALDAGWDEEMLAAELAELTESGYDLTLTGFSNEEIEDLLVDGGEGTAEESSADSDDDAADEVPETPVNPVSRPGDVWQLGAHRVICGDAADASVIATLMAGEQAALCFTSPPYGNQRNYTNTIIDWDVLMRGVFANLPMAPNGQVLVNLGLIHRDNEVIPYWEGWLDWMRTQGWRRFAWYVWDQGPGLPGDWNGRLAPSFEFVFHFNRQARQANKIVPCKFAGQETHLRKDGSSTAMRKADGTIGGWTAAGQPTQETKIPDSVIRIMRHKGKIGQDIDHPAVFPVALPQFILESYTDVGEVVFEPFCGSGTTLLAAERIGRVARATEIAPEYVDVAVKRFQQNFPEVPVTLVSTGQSFAVVANRITSGAATSHYNLGLRLIERFAGADLSLECARYTLIDTKRRSQAPYASFLQFTGHGDELVARGQAWLQEQLVQPFSLDAMARALHTSERTLMRRFRAALGDTPLHTLQRLRLHAARRLLETSSLGLEAIVEQVGYTDLSAFRRLFKREFACSPGEYRRASQGEG